MVALSTVQTAIDSWNEKMALNLSVSSLQTSPQSLRKKSDVSAHSFGVSTDVVPYKETSVQAPGYGAMKTNAFEATDEDSTEDEEKTFPKGATVLFIVMVFLTVPQIVIGALFFNVCSYLAPLYLIISGSAAFVATGIYLIVEILHWRLQMIIIPKWLSDVSAVLFAMAFLGIQILGIIEVLGMSFPSKFIMMGLKKRTDLSNMVP